MTVATTPVTRLVDRYGRTLGSFEVESEDGDLFSGTFKPGQDFVDVSPLFEEFDDLVTNQVLSLVDDVMDRIDELGIRSQTGARLYDVQIYRDGAASYRLTPPHRTT